jgi:hypothetical protein
MSILINQNNEPKKKTVNNVIPNVLTKSYDYLQKFKKRTKVNYIFNEFDQKLNKEFNFYIKESESNHKKSKYGTKLSGLIQVSKNKFNNQAEKILNDNFYTLNLDYEKKCLKHVTAKKQFKSLLNAIDSVKEFTDLQTTRKKPKKEIIEEHTIYEEFPDTKIEVPLNKENLEYQKKIVFDKLTNDQNLINNQINNYYIFTKSLSTKNLNENEENKNKKKEDDKNDANYPYLKNLNMLNYEKIKPPKIIKKIEDDYDVNLGKLLPFSRMGRNLFKFKKENKTINNENDDLILPFITTPKISLNNNVYNNNKINYNNSQNVVRQTANNGTLINEIFNKKKEDLDKKLDLNLPNLSFYEKKIKERTEKIKEEREKRNKKLGKKQSMLLINPSEYIISQIEKNSKKYDKLEEELDKENFD